MEKLDPQLKFKKTNKSPNCGRTVVCRTAVEANKGVKQKKHVDFKMQRFFFSSFFKKGGNISAAIIRVESVVLEEAADI